MTNVIRTVQSGDGVAHTLLIPGYDTINPVTIPSSGTVDLLTTLSPETLHAMQPELNLAVANGQLSVVSTITVAALWALASGSGGVSSIHADSNPSLVGAVQLVSGTNITLSQVGQAITVNSTGGAPGGVNTEIQFNNSGAFGGSSNLIWDNTNSRLGIGGLPITYQIEITKGTSGAVGVQADNTTSSGNAIFIAKNDASNTVQYGIAGSTFGGLLQSNAYIFNTAPSLEIVSSSVSGTIDLVTGGSASANIALHVSSVGALTLGPASTTPTHSLNTNTATPSTNTATLTNFPTGFSGNPTGFISITVNGNPQVIPFW